MRNLTNKGMSLVELMVAMAITTMIVIGSTSLVIMGGRIYQGGWADSTVSMDGGLAMQRLSNELRSAAYMEIANNGNQINYYMPSAQNNGDFIAPMLASTTQRWFRVQNGNLEWSGRTAPLITGLLTTDPSTGQSYTPFANVFPTARLRGIRILLNVRRVTNSGNRDYRIGQMVFLRNMK